MANSRKKQKVSLEQMTLLVEEVEKEHLLLSAKGSSKNLKVLYIEKWQSLATKLNSVENGAFKSVVKWQQTWRDWKSNMRKKVSKGADNCSQGFSSLEMRVIRLSNDETPNMKSGGIDISSIVEADPLSSGDSSNEQNGQVSVYMNSSNGNGTAEPEDDGVTIKRKKVQLFPDDNTKQQMEILSRITALEESRLELDRRHDEVLGAVAAALERQADAAGRQTDAITRLLELMERRTEFQ